MAFREQNKKTYLWVVGFNTFGNLGDNTTVHKSSPVQTVAGGTNWRQVSASTSGGAGIKTDGTLWFWGNPYDGSGNKSSPVQTVAGTNWKKVNIGAGMMAGIKTDGTLWVMGGSNFGQLGDNALINRSSPVQTITGGSDWKQVSASIGNFVGAVKTDGTLWMWGKNTTYGMLGDNTTVHKSSPVQTVAGGTNWKQVSCGENHTAAIKKDGSLWTWGRNNYGQLGTYNVINYSSPVQTILGGTDWKYASAGLFHTMMIKTDGTIWGCGYGYNGELGSGAGGNSAAHRSSPVQEALGRTDWKMVDTGYYHTAAITNDGTVYTAGYNNFGQAGHYVTGGTSFSRTFTSLTLFPGNAVYVTAGAANHTFVIEDRKDSKLWGWGNGGNYKLGNGLASSNYSPTQTAAGGNDWIHANSHEDHSLGIKRDGTLWTWGYNNRGQLGDNSILNRSTPVQEISGSEWKDGDVGYNHTAAIKTNGTMWTWGNNEYGQLGDNSIVRKSSPVQVTGAGTDWRIIESSTFHTVAIKEDGTLWTWGNNSVGQLGDNTVILKSSPVQEITNSTNWKQVSSSAAATAAIKTNGELWVWGYNNTGELGTNDGNHRSSPVQTVAGGTDWKYVTCGYNTAAIKNDGTMWIWGKNTIGQMGDGTIITRSSPVQEATNSTDWKQVVAGKLQTLALKNNGSIWGWGQNTHKADDKIANVSIPTLASTKHNWDYIAGRMDAFFAISRENVSYTKTTTYDNRIFGWGLNTKGQMGDGTLINRSSPVQTIIGSDEWEYIECGYHHTGGIKTDGTLWIWGDNNHGKLGTSEAESVVVSSPVQTVAGGSNWKQISLQYYNTVALKTDGTLWSWGRNLWGNLGDNTTTARSSPVQTVAGGFSWTQVVCGYEHTVAMKTDGSLWTWGRNQNGQLGDNTSANKSSPVQTITGGTDWSSIQGCLDHTMVIKTDGTLWAWGLNSTGQLGDNTSVSKSSPVQEATNSTNWKKVTSKGVHNNGIKTDGTAWSWGSNSWGQLGDDTIFEPTVISPVQIMTNYNWVDVASTYYGMAILNDNNVIYSSGRNNFGQLGDGTTINRSSPVQSTYSNKQWMTIVAGYTQIHAKEAETTTKKVHDYQKVTFADVYTRKDIFTEGSLWSSGRDSYGQLGDNSTTWKSSPVQTVAGGNDWKHLSLSSWSYHRHGIKADGTLWSWGRNNNGQLGNSVIGTDESSPVQIGTSNDWIQATAGISFSAGIKTDGTLWAWGDNSYGQLGIDNTTGKSSPVQEITNSNTWKQASCGAWGFMSAIKTDGTLWMWGTNDNGQLGTNEATTVKKSSPVQTVAGGNDWKQVSCGYSHTSAIKTDGTLWGWGQDFYGNLGSNSTTSKSSPVQTVAGGNDWKQLSSGEYHTGAIKTDGTLWTWGRNIYGQLGDNSVTSKSSPVQTVAGGTNWRYIGFGASASGAIKTDGTLWVWGKDNYGQLGDNEISNKSSPTQVMANTAASWRQIVIGHTLNAISVNE